ncbi:MAG: hypothetical protein U9R53_06230, partial [Chloroflexota bacterium]|nr:hypothetical protein [Chloroflexota bacterium]
FDPNTTYEWYIIGKPGRASNHPGEIVASGSGKSDDFGAVCIDAYEIPPFDVGEYSVIFDDAKNDNYRVLEYVGGSS